MEVLVTMAIVVVVIAVMGSSVRSALALDQRGAAQQLVALYQRLHDEAVMRNVSFQVMFYVREGRYVVQMSEPGMLLSPSPEERKRFEEAEAEKIRFMNEEERAAYDAQREAPFEAMSGGKMEFKLPSGTRFAGLYTPQYGAVVTGADVAEDGEGKELPLISHVLNSGYMEHTLILISDDSGDDGFTVEVEPMTGIARLHPELVEDSDIRKEVPDEGPSLSD